MLKMGVLLPTQAKCTRLNVFFNTKLHNFFCFIKCVRSRNIKDLQDLLTITNGLVETCMLVEMLHKFDMQLKTTGGSDRLLSRNIGRKIEHVPT